MSLSKVLLSNREEEQKSLNAIFNSIDKSESIIFNAGAGAGKTYALIESLKYVIRNYEKNLKKHNQQIICITYTNVATKEVKERLGNTDLVLVSTIHERIWGLIKEYQKELVEIHKEKLEDEILNLKQKLKIGREYSKYRELEDDLKGKFEKIMIENKELFFQNYSVTAAELKKSFKTILNDYSDILKNVSNFRKIVNTIYKLDRYRKCYENIISNKKGYKSVEYNSIYNSDQLHKMRISHDTLLDYGLKIIEKYDLLKQIIMDKYPFVFIDEYQDTDEKVVLIMSYLEQYAKKIGHNIFIGYFGDTAQNIYDGGVGSEITKIHSGLKPINKVFNRRSTKEVIEVINKIRNDNIQQISIYDDCEGGSVKFYKGTSDNVKDLLDKYIHEWKITTKNQLHCLVLTNKIVAEYSGFKNIYEAFKETDKYKGINYNQLNTELFSNDLSKLGEIPKLLFNIVRLQNNLLNKTTSVMDISPKESLFDDMSIEGLKKLIKSLKEHKGKTLGEYIESISTVYSQVNDENYKKIIDWTFGFENITFELFKNYLIGKLFNQISDDDIDHANTTIQKMLEVDIAEYDLWYKFIMDKQEEKVIYHTYHGTKGREFDNVIIIMENAFGRNRDYFNFFFENSLHSDVLEDERKRNLEKIKNLLYVSCSRAIKNLRVIYIDDVTSFESGIKEIFGEIYLFSNN
ncbi:Gabija anti-phage system protein GajB [Bacillus cereus group sp. Bc177]|uniref:Gabija anti-phage system protein GajB n=1 Tax=Bacillus cereus group sp. Bc177 TaxID=3018114 RepID=UPI0022E093EF|nr:Gabija anti-phage system protein GajB [Bacillus cereus group sp. Bc177]MDA2323963.1 AAA family ATPase [Bacillus cereus group sp. Bc177]